MSNAVERVRERKRKLFPGGCGHEACGVCGLCKEAFELLALHDEAVQVIRAIRKRAKTPVSGRWIENTFIPQRSGAEGQAINAEAAAADAFLAKAGGK
jgi:hypothetical protein